MPRLSIILITKNEAAHIRACLESCAFADEIIVVDGASTDGTADIAREMGARVETHADWPGFGPQKNRALDYASGDWVFSLDADERITPVLQQAILQTMADNRGAVWQVPRRSRFCGQWVHHSGWWPDHVIRLFRRGTARFSDDRVHERLLTDETIGTLSEPLLHYTYDTLEQVLAKVNRYSSDGAAMRQQRGKRASITQALLHGLWAFLRTYLLRRGFLDGRAGFLIALMNAEASFYRYAKLYYLNARDHQ